MNLADDIRTMLTLAAPLAGGLPTQVTLPGGAVVQAFPQLASQDDSLIHGDLVICGQTRKLLFTTEDAPALKTRQNVQWNGQTWGILATDLDANGSITSCFIGKAF